MLLNKASLDVIHMIASVWNYYEYLCRHKAFPSFLKVDSSSSTLRRFPLGISTAPKRTDFFWLLVRCCWNRAVVLWASLIRGWFSPLPSWGISPQLESKFYSQMSLWNWIVLKNIISLQTLQSLWSCESYKLLLLLFAKANIAVTCLRFGI